MEKEGKADIRSCSHCGQMFENNDHDLAHFRETDLGKELHSALLRQYPLGICKQCSTEWLKHSRLPSESTELKLSAAAVCGVGMASPVGLFFVVSFLVAVLLPLTGPGSLLVFIMLMQFGALLIGLSTILVLTCTVIGLVAKYKGKHEESSKLLRSAGYGLIGIAAPFAFILFLNLFD